MADGELTHPGADERFDVVIAGAGLAGLTLALQLRREVPSLSICVVERQKFPYPISAHKVGESTVEIGAHYFAHVLGLRDHLDRHHLRKFGFRFFFSEGMHDFDDVIELGASRYLAVPTYQIDRGLFENHLAERARSEGVVIVEGARVDAIELQAEAASGDRAVSEAMPIDAAAGGNPVSARHAARARAARRDHRIGWQQGSVARHAYCRWFIDASGRAGLLKRQLNLAMPNGHAAHSVWFRIDHRIDVDAWSSAAAWQKRCTVPERWLSTNHLCGEGYWVWLIPLSSGSHSVGIVADPAVHPLDTMNTFDKAMDWIGRFQPRLYQELDPQRGTLQDFRAFRRFSYDCRQTFSEDRWALVGEAGRFLDPFYSPGSDFIAIGNTYVTKLIELDTRSAPIAGAARTYDALYRTFYDNMLPLYEGQYPVFGSARLMTAKVLWDYTYYWSVLAPLFFHGRIADLELLSSASSDLATCSRLNQQVQDYLRHAYQRKDTSIPTVALDQCSLDWFVELNRRLNDRQDAAQVRAGLADAADLLRRVAHEIMQTGDAGATRLLVAAPADPVAT